MLFIDFPFHFTDNVRVPIQDQDSIDALSDKYTEALVYHIEKTRKKEEHMLPKIINALTELRTSNHVFQNVWCSVLRDFPEIEVSELFREMKFCDEEY